MNRPAAIIRMRSDRQLRKVRRLIQSLCANYFEGNCVLLDDGYDATVCPQAITYSLCCRYFLAAVLPADAELHAELMQSSGRKRCAACGQPFAAKGKRYVRSMPAFSGLKRLARRHDFRCAKRHMACR